MRQTQGDKVLVGRFPVECCVGAFIVVEELIAGEGGLHRVDAQGAIVASPELDAGSAVGAFHTAVVLGMLGRQHMQRDVQRFTGRLEAGHELAAAVDLDGDERERQGRQQFVQEAPYIISEKGGMKYTTWYSC